MKVVQVEYYLQLLFMAIFIIRIFKMLAILICSLQMIFHISLMKLHPSGNHPFHIFKKD